MDASSEIQAGDVRPVLSEEDSSWEVCSEAGSSEFESDCDAGSDEESGDEVLRHRDRKRPALP